MTARSNEQILVEIVGQNQSILRALGETRREMQKLAGDTQKEAEKTSRVVSALTGAVAGAVAGFVQGAAMNAIRAVPMEIGRVNDAFDDLQTSVSRLRGTADLFGVSWDFVNKVADETAAKFNLSERQANDLTQGLIRLTASARSVGETGPAIEAFMNVAAMRGMNVEQTLVAVTQAMRGIDDGTDKLFDKNPSEIFEEWAERNGRAASSLTIVEQRRAILEEGLRTSNRVGDQYNQWLQTAAGREQAVASNAENVRAALGEAWSEARIRILEEWNDELVEFAGWLDENKDEIAEIADLFADLALNIRDAVMWLAEFGKYQFKTVDELIQETAASSARTGIGNLIDMQGGNLGEEIEALYDRRARLQAEERRLLMQGGAIGTDNSLDVWAQSGFFDSGHRLGAALSSDEPLLRTTQRDLADTQAELAEVNRELAARLLRATESGSDDPGGDPPPPVKLADTLKEWETELSSLSTVLAAFRAENLPGTEGLRERISAVVERARGIVDDQDVATKDLASAWGLIRSGTDTLREDAREAIERDLPNLTRALAAMTAEGREFAESQPLRDRILGRVQAAQDRLAEIGELSADASEELVAEAASMWEIIGSGMGAIRDSVERNVTRAMGTLGPLLSSAMGGLSWVAGADASGRLPSPDLSEDQERALERIEEAAEEKFDAIRSAVQSSTDALDDFFQTIADGSIETSEALEELLGTFLRIAGDQTIERGLSELFKVFDAAQSREAGEGATAAGIPGQAGSALSSAGSGALVANPALGLGLIAGGFALNALGAIFGGERDREEEMFRAHLRALRESRREEELEFNFYFPAGVIDPSNPDWQEAILETEELISRGRRARVNVLNNEGA